MCSIRFLNIFSHPSSLGKEESIETLRGLAILVLVAFHSAGSIVEKTRGTFNYAYFNYSISILHVPLFTMISGYVYALHPIADKAIGTFLLGKARRLLLPLFVATTLTILLKAIIPGSTERYPLSDVWRAYLFSYDHFWFLQAIFLVFFVIVLLERLKLFDSISRWVVTLVAFVLLYVCLPSSDFFSFRGFLQLLPFFVLGVGLKRFADLLFTTPMLVFASILAFIGLFTKHVVWWADLEINTPYWTMLSLGTGMVCHIILFRLRRAARPLMYLGYYAYPIYLYHLMAISLGRRGIAFLGVQNVHLIFIGKLVIGLFVPIVATLFLQRWNITARLFLGLRSGLHRFI